MTTKILLNQVEGQDLYGKLDNHRIKNGDLLLIEWPNGDLTEECVITTDYVENINCGTYTLTPTVNKPYITRNIHGKVIKIDLIGMNVKESN